jgi:hypothetical protein
MTIPEYIPYIKYVISPGTRFERDKKVLFDPDGDVAKGKPLLNYGWAPSGLKEFIEALYKSRGGNPEEFDNFYEKKILRSNRNIVDVLREEGLIDQDLPALIVIKIRENIEVPALLVTIDRMFFKRCSACEQSWEKNSPPSDFKEFLEELGLENVMSVFQCSRQLCKFLCDHYSYCEKSYTSTEASSEVEKERIECLKTLFKLMAGKISETRKYECILREKIPSEVGCKELKSLEGKKMVQLNFKTFKELVNNSEKIKCNTCIERPLRFDFKPIRYFFFDYRTWKKMQKQRYCKTSGRRNIDALPAKLLSEFIDFYDEYSDGTQLVAPINHSGVLEAFLNVSDIKFELKHYIEYRCPVCGLTHKIIKIPIKAMFKDSEVFVHEAYFANLLYEALWKNYPIQFCNSFEGKTQIDISESKVLKREVKVKDIDQKSRFPLNSYDYVVDLSKIGKNRLLVFDLTTGLWKKSGFHEIGRTTEDYIEAWKELLFNVPIRISNVYAVWYIVINSTEEKFFDETAPNGVRNLDSLVDVITSSDGGSRLIVKSETDVNHWNSESHKLVVVPVFNSTPLKGEARWELKRLKSREYNKILIWTVVNRLLA